MIKLVKKFKTLKKGEKIAIVVGGVVVLAGITLTAIAFINSQNNGTSITDELQSEISMLTGSPTTVSDAQVLRTQNREGFKLYVYADSGGVLTVGYGHTGADVNALGLGAAITTAQALQWLNQDLNNAAQRVLNTVTVNLNQNQLDALTDFVFNTGRTNSDLFSVYVNNGDWDGAQTFLRNHYITDSAGNHLNGLVDRRNEEADLLVAA